VRRQRRHRASFDGARRARLRLANARALFSGRDGRRGATSGRDEVPPRTRPSKRPLGDIGIAGAEPHARQLSDWLRVERSARTFAEIRDLGERGRVAAWDCAVCNDASLWLVARFD
jgi:hypothetical protein